VIANLEEVLVKSAEDVIQVLQRGIYYKNKKKKEFYLF